jgi:hypothetical protein
MGLFYLQSEAIYLIYLNLMANPLIYNGNPGPISGSTPFGFYDNDTEYQQDGPKVANYCARKLGYPVLDVELQDLNIYACFEEAVSIYAEELYQLKIKDNYLTLEGQPTSSLLNNTVVSPNLTNLLNISETYGQPAGVGGFVSWKSGSLDLKANVQNYDLYDWAVNTQGMDPNDRIVIQRVMYQAPPALYQYGYGSYYPQLGGAGAWPGNWGGYGFAGWGGVGNAVTYYPVFWTISMLQEVEMQNTVNLPAWTFELIGTNLRLMPIPRGDGGKISLQYAFQSDLMSLTENSPYGDNQGLVANPSMAPYGLITYSDINQPGKQWIKEYTAALTSELLGLVRGKYQVVQIPGAETTLNYADLISRGQAMQKDLREKLRLDLEDMSRQKQLERKQSENDSLKDTLVNIPIPMFIG